MMTISPAMDNTCFSNEAGKKTLKEQKWSSIGRSYRLQHLHVAIKLRIQPLPLLAGYVVVGDNFFHRLSWCLLHIFPGMTHGVILRYLLFCYHKKNKASQKGSTKYHYHIPVTGASIGSKTNGTRPQCWEIFICAKKTKHQIWRFVLKLHSLIFTHLRSCLPHHLNVLSLYKVVLSWVLAISWLVPRTADTEQHDLPCEVYSVVFLLWIENEKYLAPELLHVFLLLS